MSDLYETDFHAWALQQADALRRRSANEVDWDNLQDEVESLGRSEQNELESRLAVLQTHLLKWRFQPELQSRSWLFTIATQRADIDKHLRKNPSLRPRTTEALLDSYPGARRRAAYEMATIEKDLPPSPPWTFEDAMTSPVEYDEHFHPRSSTRNTKG
jgi:hypothetical protein